MRFQDIPGHDEVKARLISMVDSGHIPHALLLEGPAGAGKFSLARALAQYIHCEHRIPGKDSCGTCPSCRQHQALGHVDTIYSFPVIKRDGSKSISDDFMREFAELLDESPFMDYELWLSKLSNPNAKPVIYVDEATELTRKLSFTTRAAAFKIVVMWLPERMNEECANKLLKLIEEPPADTLFILTSDVPRQVLPTIYSRTQRVKVHRYTEAEVASILEEQYSVDAESAVQIGRLSDGSMVAAINLISVSKERKEYLELFMELMRKCYGSQVAALKQWAVKVADLGREREVRFLEYCARMLRENFMLNFGNDSLTALDTEEWNFCSKFSPFVNERNVLKLFQFFNDAKTDILGNANAKLVNFDLSLKVGMVLKN